LAFGIWHLAFGIDMATLQLDEQLRRYQDLTRRASDLRSYL